MIKIFTIILFLFSMSNSFAVVDLPKEKLEKYFEKPIKKIPIPYAMYNSETRTIGPSGLDTVLEYAKDNTNPFKWKGSDIVNVHPYGELSRYLEFVHKVCKGAALTDNKDKVVKKTKTTLTPKIHQFNLATKCKKNRFGYYAHFRLYSDPEADDFCKTKDKIAVFNGKARIESQPFSRIGSILGIIPSTVLGDPTFTTGQHVSASYLCLDQLTIDKIKNL